MINRMLNIPMSDENKTKEMEIIKYLAVKNGYQPHIVDKMIQKKTRKINKTNTIRPNPNNNEIQKYICVPFNTKINKAVRKTFQNSKFSISYQTRNNTFKLIENKISQKDDKQDLYKQCGVYKINCSDCESYYIGQTGRNFNKRFKEHIQALKTNNMSTIKSNFAEHLLETGHNYKNIEKNMEILDIERKGEKLNTKEELHIYLNYKKDPHNILNSNLKNKTNPIFEKISNTES
ncbi:hypothetical protein J6590_108507 [Homalodisca vitripennis]|nr:hypothetical protein J6590_108828 [Homalodisca vitripennis]KAG8269050.1 hypothetical protein J6590_108507 [Homalodisca vitripennis]